MPTEVCWGCKQLKSGVKLCAEDRLCRECDAANQCALSAARIETEKNSKQSQSVKNTAKHTGSSSLSSIHSQPVHSSPQSNVVINGASISSSSLATNSRSTDALMVARLWFLSNR